MNEYFPDEVSHPKETLREFFAEHGIEVRANSTLGGDLIAPVLEGDKPITAWFAIQLERIGGPPAPFWLVRQRNYDEAQRQSSADVSPLT